MRRLFAVLLILLSFSGCAARPIHPGAANQFDSTAYDTIFIAHNVIESTKADLAANKFPASIATNVVTALNKLVTAYNLADQAYLAYHNAALGGTATPAQQAALQSNINDVSNAVSSVASAKGGVTYLPNDHGNAITAGCMDCFFYGEKTTIAKELR